MLTFDGNDELRNDRQYLLTPSPCQKIINALDCKEDIRMLCLPQAIKEEWKVVMIVQGLEGDLPRYSISSSVML